MLHWLSKHFVRFLYFFILYFLADLKQLLSVDDYAKCHLIVAGGYDKRNEENIAYFSQLVGYSKDLGISDSQVTFLKSPCKFFSSTF